MCDTLPRAEEKPEVKVADLMQRELGVRPDPAALRLFVQHYWTRLTCLAHAIHDADTASFVPYSETPEGRAATAKARTYGQ